MQVQAHIINKKPAASSLISINYLEYMVIILAYNTFLDSIEYLNSFSGSSYSKGLFLTDNTTADSWTRKMATSSLMGKRLNRIFCSLLMNQDLGIDSDHIPGDRNNCADSISCLLLHSLSSLTSLLQEYPFLHFFHQYYPPHELLSMIFSSLTTSSEAALIPRRLRGCFIITNSTTSPGVHT